MTKLSDFGAGALPEKNDEKIAHKTRSDRAKHRRNTYRLGRCRAISTSKGCRCGGAVIDDTDGEFCYYHGVATDPATIDSHPGLIARWCGSRPTMWDEIPEPCREALVRMSFRRHRQGSRRDRNEEHIFVKAAGIVREKAGLDRMADAREEAIHEDYR